PRARISTLHLALGGLPEQVRDPACGSIVIGRECESNVAIVEDRIVRAVGLFELIERLRNQECLKAIPGNERDGRFEELEAAERRELVEEEEKPVAVSGFATELHELGEPATDLVQHQANEW